MADPRLGDKQRIELFSGLIKAELPQAARNFIELLVQNDRLLLPVIASQFEALRNRHDGTAQAEITSAFELSEAQVKELVAALEQKFGLKLKPSVTVDQSLIGGVRVAVGDRARYFRTSPIGPHARPARRLRRTYRIPGVYMQLNPSEISELLKSRIEGLGASADVRTQGTVVSVTDGITRIHGLSDVMQGEMLEFPNNVYGLALNLERDSVGAVILGDYTGVSEGDRSRRPAAFWKCRSAPNCAAAWSTRWASRSTARARSTPRPPTSSKKWRRRYRPPLGVATAADRHQGYRLDGPDRPRPARTDHRRPPDRQDRRGRRHHHQPEGQGRHLYVAIGQKASTINNVVRKLEEHGALEYTIVVAASASDSAAMQYRPPTPVARWASTSAIAAKTP